MATNHIICQNCKTENLNSDYCSNCGEIINIVLKRKLEQVEYRKTVEKNKLVKEPSKYSVFLIKLRNHPNILIKGIFYILYSISFVAMTIAMGIGALVASLAG